MKIYAIGYELINGKYQFFIYTDTWISERSPIDEDFYEQLKSRFTLAHRNNKSLSGIYFEATL